VTKAGVRKGGGERGRGLDMSQPRRPLSPEWLGNFHDG